MICYTCNTPYKQVTSYADFIEYMQQCNCEETTVREPVKTELKPATGSEGEDEQLFP